MVGVVIHMRPWKEDRKLLPEKYKIRTYAFCEFSNIGLSIILFFMAKILFDLISDVLSFWFSNIFPFF